MLWAASTQQPLGGCKCATVDVPRRASVHGSERVLSTCTVACMTCWSGVLVALLQMKDFALRGYKSATSLAFHKAPNSAVGRVMGLVYR